MHERKRSHSAEMIEALSYHVLEELKNGNQEVEIDKLVDLVDYYCNSSEYNEEDATRWAERLDEISKIFTKNADDISMQLGNLLSHSPKIKAYTKTMNLGLKED